MGTRSIVHPSAVATISDLRRDLFKAADRALEGQQVAFTYKGKTLRLVSDERPSRLARLTRNNFVAPGVDLEKASKELAAEMQAAWESDWADL